jgi:hypothetical protein
LSPDAARRCGTTRGTDSGPGEPRQPLAADATFMDTRRRDALFPYLIDIAPRLGFITVNYRYATSGDTPRTALPVRRNLGNLTSR